MARKIFEKYQNIKELVLPYDRFVSFYDRGGLTINPEHRDRLIEAF